LDGRRHLPDEQREETTRDSAVSHDLIVMLDLRDRGTLLPNAALR